MGYSVVQTARQPIAFEQLEPALLKVPGVTALDAKTLVRDAFGVLVKGFELPSASALLTALAEQGFETEVVEDAIVADPAPGKQLNQVDLSPEAFVVYDLLGRGNPIPWTDVSLIAAGQVKMSEFKTTFSPKIVMQARHYAPTVVMARETAEEQATHLLLEVFTRPEGTRYHVVADLPESMRLFQCLGDRKSREPLINLTCFVDEAAKLAPGAVLNYGAWSLARNHDATFTYPGKTAFYREIAWLLWMLANGRIG